MIDRPGQSPLPWWSTGLDLPGRVLAGSGLQAPTLYPERLVLLAAVQV